jgi:hypothetical protein
MLCDEMDLKTLQNRKKDSTTTYYSRVLFQHEYNTILLATSYYSYIIDQTLSPSFLANTSSLATVVTKIGS